MTSRWLVLQLADAAFPTGAFAHSGGLEAASRLGEIASTDDLEAFVDASIWQAGRLSLPFVVAGHDDPDAIVTLDRMCDATLVDPVANRASRSQGRALASTCAHVFPAIRAIDDAVRSRALRVHVAPAFGTILRRLEIGRDDAMSIHLHASLRATLSAAVRLGLCGPHEAQRVTHERAPLLDRVLATCAAISIEGAAHAAPLVDLFGMAHDRLDVRLFIS